MSDEVAMGIKKLAYAILTCAAEDFNCRTNYKSPHASRVALNNKKSAVKFFAGEWFVEIAQALQKNPQWLREGLIK